MNHIFASRSAEMTALEQTNTYAVRSLSGECMVLLRNNGSLPLAPGPVALFGTGAFATVKGGTGSGDVNTRDNITIDRGLRSSGFAITTDAWLSRGKASYDLALQAYLCHVPERAEELGISEVSLTFREPFQAPAPVPIESEDLEASHTDTVIYVIARNAGEGADRSNARGDYRLFEEEKNQLELLGRTYSKVIVVLNIGGVMDLSELSEIPGISAILLMGQLGATGGLALADVLTGSAYPSGKLTDTWAKNYQDYLSSAGFSHNDGNTDDEFYTEGIYVGYRGFDSFQIEPLYPFGFGLSYTTFALSQPRLLLEDARVSLYVTVRNTGSFIGKEVVQAYFSAPAGDLPKPYQELIGYVKTKALNPGEEEQVCICWDVKDMASYSAEAAAWVLDAGDYVVRVGCDSRNTRAAAVLRLKHKMKTAVLRNLFHDPVSLREITPPVLPDTPVEALPVLSVCENSIPCVTATYHDSRPTFSTQHTKMLTANDIKSGICSVEDLTAQLTVEELADLCVGMHRTNQFTECDGMLGNNSNLVPGAAGDTSGSLYPRRGIKNIIMADGPAGLRLQPVFKTDKQGNLLPGGEMIGGYPAAFNSSYTNENSDTYYQYCTSIPIGWSLAQSWSPELLESVGTLIGREMAAFGVDLWLAPALNIHRNPLCGRNFEYYSEDPLISGKCAAAITRGVQSCSGKGVTIKHFAANSQEDNRYFSNSHISERALREIYLKGFQIAITESDPMALMTSYNLINGTHAANHFDLLQSVCRDEWGYNGLIMTDWYTSQDVPAFTGVSACYPVSSSTGCIKAGNDLQMPGSQKNLDDIVNAITSGVDLDGYRITLGDLQFCAANVIRAALRMNP